MAVFAARMGPAYRAHIATIANIAGLRLHGVGSKPEPIVTVSFG